MLYRMLLVTRSLRECALRCIPCILRNREVAVSASRVRCLARCLQVLIPFAETHQVHSPETFEIQFPASFTKYGICECLFAGYICSRQIADTGTGPYLVYKTYGFAGWSVLAIDSFCKHE